MVGRGTRRSTRVEWARSNRQGWKTKSKRLTLHSVVTPAKGRLGYQCVKLMVGGGKGGMRWTEDVWKRRVREDLEVSLGRMSGLLGFMAFFPRHRHRSRGSSLGLASSLVLTCFCKVTCNYPSDYLLFHYSVDC